MVDVSAAAHRPPARSEAWRERRVHGDGGMIESALVLPIAPALLPHFSAEDPVADLREACTRAVGSCSPPAPDA